MTFNYYKLLNIPISSSDDDIKDSISYKTRIWSTRCNSPHLERRQKAERMLKTLEEAQLLLLNPEKRKKYDQSLLKEVEKRKNVPKCPKCGIRRRVGSSQFCPVCNYNFKHSGNIVERETPPNHKNYRNRASSNPFPNSTHDQPFENNSDTNHQSPFSNSHKRRKRQDLPITHDEKYSVPVTATPLQEDIIQDSDSGFFKFFDWESLNGTVISIDQQYMARPEINWLAVFIKMTIGIMLLYFFFAFAVVIIVVSILSSIFFSPSAIKGSGCLTGMIKQILGFSLTRFFFQPKEQVPVRDFRLRDINSGGEHLIRIRGELISGNINVGDHIMVEGFNRNGTLIARRGWNYRTNSAINVRYR
jgi:curved DNA-binding protein CbpA